jgi:hypothetical protein
VNTVRSRRHWWVLRVLRYLHDIQAGADQRPAQRRPDRHAELPELYARYLALAQELRAAS